MRCAFFILGLLCLLGLPLQAELIRVPLSKRTLDWRASERGEHSDPALSRVAQLPSKELWTAPEERIKGAPKFHDPVYYILAAGGRGFFAVMDVTDDLKKAALYIDFAGTGEFDKIKPFIATDPKWKENANSANFTFEPVIFPPVPGAAGAPTDAMINCRVSKHSKAGPYMLWRPNSCVSGTFQPPIGTPRTVAFVNNAYTGNFEKSGTTWMAVSRYYDGTFSEDWDISPLLEMVRINGKFYHVKLALDGSEAEFQETALPMGVLDTQSTDTRLLVMSDQCVAMLDSNFVNTRDNSSLSSKWELPAGHYTIVHYTLERLTQVENRPHTWEYKGTLRGDGGIQASFEIKPGATTVRTMGEALKLSYAVRAGATDEVLIKLKPLIGKGGESYDLNGSHAPTLTILDEKGEKLASGKFEFG